MEHLPITNHRIPMPPVMPLKPSLGRNQWNLDPSSLRIRIPIGSRCLVTDVVGYTHLHETKWLCGDMAETAEYLVKTEQGYWTELNDIERAEIAARRPWWMKLLGLGKI